MPTDITPEFLSLVTTEQRIVAMEIAFSTLVAAIESANPGFAQKCKDGLEDVFMRIEPPNAEMIGIRGKTHTLARSLFDITKLFPQDGNA